MLSSRWMQSLSFGTKEGYLAHISALTYNRYYLEGIFEALLIVNTVLSIPHLSSPCLLDPWNHIVRSL